MEKYIEMRQNTHLDYIQAVIMRMGQNSLQVKTWCVTMLAALLAFYTSQDKTDNHVASFTIPLLVILFFAAMDVYYLYLEKGYRSLYEAAAKLNSNIVIRDYDMERPKEVRGSKIVFQALRSPAIWVFYGAMAGCHVALYGIYIYMGGI